MPEAQKTVRKIGARILTENEVRLILPTYDKIKEQITMIREENSQKMNEVPSDLEIIQKTNNIGIMGARGTGKTSVMKTLMSYLKEQNKKGNKIKNILLPFIVPENMSETMKLMSTILGLFKKEVDKIEKKHTDSHMECWEQKRLEVVKRYNELVKKFCYIQKEFRAVSIGQYTTENDYVRKSSEIFNSDIEFIHCLNQFIEIFLKEDCFSEDALIFLFIDDIDLSTHRCTDVVKTLLSYISHPKIVTFLSGDLDTFEEALTIDFLRQEQALSGGLLEQEFLNTGENTTLLARKKVLTYEYLKKIIPPVYRHSVKKWSIYDRGNYIVLDGEQREETDNENALANLLTQTFREYDCSSFFQYYNYLSTDSSAGFPKKSMLPQVFHLFDDTSRGLNNVYNALLDTRKVFQDKSNNKNEYEQKCFQAVKVFLETIVASNAQLNEYRESLFGNIIYFGSNFETTSIRCDNFKNIVYRKTINELKKERYVIGKALTRFRLFVFLDFSLRVLKQNYQFSDASYQDIKKLAVLDLINHPIISGSTETFNLDQRKSNREGFEFKNSEIPDSNILKKTIKDTLTVLSGFLQKSEFNFTMIFYHNISNISYLIIGFLNNCLISSKIKENNKYEPELYSFCYQIVLDVYYTFLSLSTSQSKDTDSIMADYLEDFRELFEILIHIVGGNPLSNFIQKVFGTNFIPELDTESKYYLLQPYYNYLMYVCQDSVFADGKIKLLEENRDSYLSVLDEKKKNPFRAIAAIDKYDLWENEFSKQAQAYINHQIYDIVEQYDTKYELFLCIKSLKQPYEKFKAIYKGVTNTLAAELENSLENIFKEEELFESSQQDKENDSITVNLYIEIMKQVERVAFSRAWYGVSEALSMRRALQQSYWEFHKKSNTDNTDETSLSNNLKIWLHCYACSVSKDLDLEDIYQHSKDMADFSKSLYQAFRLNNQKSMLEYKNLLAKDLDESLIDNFESLFEIKKPKRGAKTDAE